MTARLSVTEVRNALRCPRIFALGRVTGAAVAFPVGSSCLGASFHRIVELFTRSVATPPPYFAALPHAAARDEVDAQLARWLLARLAFELDADPTYATIPGEVDDLAEALREFARHLSARLTSFSEPPAQALMRLLHGGERELQAPLGDDGSVVHGRLDAIYADAHGALEIVEYKLTDETNEELDRAQVVLYRELLRDVDEVAARATVLRFTPTLREVRLSSDDADATARQTVLPLLKAMVQWAEAPLTAPATSRRDLCATCPVAEPCRRHFPERLSVRDDAPMAGTRPRPDAQRTLSDARSFALPSGNEEDEAGHREAEALRDTILGELRAQAVGAECPRPPTVGPTLYLIEVACRRGPVSHLDRAAESVQHRLASKAGLELEYSREGGRRQFQVRRTEPRVVLLDALLDEQRDWLARKPGRLIIGQQLDGRVLTADLSDASTPHLLIAGQTGSGKSVLIQSLIASLVQYHGPSAVRFTLVDPKRVTFTGAAFRAAVAAHLDGPVRHDIEDTLPALDQLVDLMEERYRAFETSSVSDLDEFNEAHPDAPLERRVLIIDEFQDLATEKKLAEAFFQLVKRLGAKARAAGIHLILATQRPDSKTVPGVIKANLGGKIALQVSTATNSRIILDRAGAEKLFGKGDLLASLGRGLVRAQAPLLRAR